MLVSLPEGICLQFSQKYPLMFGFICLNHHFMTDSHRKAIVGQHATYPILSPLHPCLLDLPPNHTKLPKTVFPLDHHHFSIKPHDFPPLVPSQLRPAAQRHDHFALPKPPGSAIGDICASDLYGGTRGMIYGFLLVVLTILKNISQWGGLSHILWKIKNVPNHQPESVMFITAVPVDWVLRSATVNTIWWNTPDEMFPGSSQIIPRSSRKSAFKLKKHQSLASGKRLQQNYVFFVGN